MTFPPSPLVFDGHNDLILRMIQGDVTAEAVANGMDSGHIDLPRAKTGGFAGGLFAIFVPSAGNKGLRMEEMLKPTYDIPLPDPVEGAEAQKVVEAGFSALDALSEAGAVVLCRTAAELEAALPGEPMAAVAHMEGAEAIDRDFEALHLYHARGLRSLGPVWSRPTIWGHGVPFRFPSDPDIGPGLTEAGKALIAQCNHLNILVDLSHLNAAGVEDVARISNAPLVASHSNAWSITPHPRNLTDRQLAMIRESKGLVGVNFASAFLRPDGRMEDDFDLDIMLRHFDHLIETVGEDGVSLGSDFDGALVPKPIRDCAGLPALMTALRLHGVDDALLAKLAHGNWLRVLSKTWGG